MMLMPPSINISEPTMNGHSSEASKAAFTLPLLILHGTADKATRPGGSQLFYDTANSRDKTLKLYEGHFHDMLNDVGKEGVIADIRRWISERIPVKAAASQ